jgi:hypothetical protein
MLRIILDGFITLIFFILIYFGVSPVSDVAICATGGDI